jgi:hypothetical protein
MACDDYASVGIPAPPHEEHPLAMRAQSSIVMTITQSHENLYHSCYLLGRVLLMGMVLLEFCLPSLPTKLYSVF